MPLKLEIKPFIKQEGCKYRVIRITDIALHTSIKQTKSIGKKIKQAFNSMKPGRLYDALSPTELFSSPTENKNAVLDLIINDPECAKMISEEEQNGYKVLIGLPKEIPVVLGKDTMEFLASINGKRILRKLAKNP